MSITTEAAERLAIILNRLDMDRNATALRSLAAERDALKAENARLRAALRELIYETTHLSPQEDDGSHRCTITGETLRKARAALGEKE
jgi:predicted  nucleic acid-binding Zn-ribbon protein